jgi:hypothetical protein
MVVPVPPPGTVVVVVDPGVVVVVVVDPPGGWVVVVVDPPGGWVVVVVEVVVVVVVGPPPGPWHAEASMMLDCNVTAPFRARARPFKVAPVFMPMDVNARIFPINEVFVPRVAELGTRHHTLHGSPPTTLAVPEVMRVDPDLKIQTPDPLRVSVPDNVKAPVVPVTSVQ